MPLACVIDWQAIATFFTGFAAVGAAFWIGRKQTRIQEASIRLQLLEHRRESIATMQDIEAEFWREGQLRPDVRQRFWRVYFDAELLFSRILASEMHAAISSSIKAEAFDRIARTHKEYGEDQAANKVLDDFFAEDERVFTILPNLLKKMQEEARMADFI